MLIVVMVWNKSDFGDDADKGGGNSNDDDGVIVKKVFDT